MGKTLGLDLGTNSIGWAVVDDEAGKILGAGSRIFTEGVMNLGEGSNEMSRNASRREARGARRQLFRRRLRKDILIQELAKHDMIPVNPEKVSFRKMKDIINSNGFQDWVTMNPYELRASALEEKISLQELGRIFYHMIQRRGFQSNSRSAGKEDGAIYEGKSDDNKIGILETRESIEGQTLGSYLQTLHPDHKQPYTFGLERIRNRYTTRQMYIDEFEKIWESQKQYHPELTDELKTKIGGRKKDGYSDDGILFHQRPLRSQKSLVGNCTFEPKKTKCPKSAIPFELYRIYQWVNTVECNGEKLSAEQREILVTQLLKKEKQNFSALRKVLKKAGSEFQFNYKDDDKIYGSHTIANLSNKKFFGQDWFKLSEKEQEEIWHDLYFYEDKDKLKERALNKWGFDEEKADAISKFNLKDGYAHVSRKAINNILPFLKMGYTYDGAVALGGIKNAFGSRWEKLDAEEKSTITDNIWDVITYKEKGSYITPLREFLKTEFDLDEKSLQKLYHHSTNISQNEILDKLPLGKEADAEIQSIRNPVVITALFEVRKVVNELIDRFGKFDEIKIELARDLKISKDRRNDIRKEQKRLERENDRVKKELENHNQHISHVNILKYKLWEECNQTCPFTGKKIEISQLFTGLVQIEHIHPWSRSLNDSYMNKTLCFADENRAKGNRTPFEFYYNEQGEEKWEMVKAQALRCFKNKPNYPSAYHKFKHFVKKTHDDDFTSRQLNDTRYISREAKTYLSKICANIIVAPGQSTSNLRAKWGLNSILNIDDEKKRDDHRHHAIDALVMACTKVSYLQELSKWNRYDRKYDVKDFPLPWENFRGQAEEIINGILVSHKKTNTVLTKRKHRIKKKGKVYVNTGIAARGQLHKETVFGKRISTQGNEAYHVRKSIESLTTKKQVEKVVDPVIRQIIHRRIEELGGYEKEKNVPKDAFFGTDELGNKIPKIFLPNRNGDPVPVRKVRVRENLSGAERLKETNQYVNPRNNHHVLIYKDANGDLKEDSITFWTAVERKAQGQNIVQLPPGGREFVTTLQINDMFIIGINPEEIDNYDNPKIIASALYRVQKVSDGDYSFRFHSASTLDFKDQEVRITSMKKWQNLNPIKVIVSPSGVLKMV